MVKTRASSTSAFAMETRNHGRAELPACSAISKSRRKNGGPFNQPTARCRRRSRQKRSQQKLRQKKAQDMAGVGCVEVSVEQGVRGPGDTRTQVGKLSATSRPAICTSRKGSRRSYNRPMGRRRRGATEKRCYQQTRPKRIREVARVDEMEVSVEPRVQGPEERQTQDGNEAAKRHNRSAELRTVRALNCNDEDSEPVEISRPEEGWTMDQEEALHNAYFLVRPSSKFWFEISKKVPGKTAKECFDRFYSAHPTPLAPQTRSQKQVTESPIRAISFSSPMSTVKSRYHSGRGKQVLLKAHQTVRHILRKQQVADGSYEADVFAAVEQADPTPLSALEVPSNHFESSVVTPNHSLNLIGSGRRNFEVVWRSMSVKKKELLCLSQQSQSSTKVNVQGQLLSPEVLKTERNPGRLDRYLDMLHLRRVDKQKSSFHRGRAQGRCSREKRLIMTSKTEKVLTQGVSGARDAIVADAKEMLRTVLHQQDSGDEITNLLHDEAEESSSLIFDE